MKVLSSLVLVFLITGGVVARAGDSESERQTLKGLKGVQVIVETVAPEVERAGLTRASIQTDVELKLRLAGIPIVDLVSSPYLYVHIAFHPVSDGIWPFHINVEIMQGFHLVRDTSIFGVGSTWSVVYIGRVGKPNVRGVRDNVNDQVDVFINAYLSVNPK